MNDVRRALAEVADREVPAGGVDLWPSIRAAVSPRAERVERGAPRTWQGRLRGAAEVVWVAALCVGVALVLRSALDAGTGPAPSPTAGVPGGAPQVTPEPTPEAAPTALPTPTAAPGDPTPAPEPTYEARPTERHYGLLRYTLSANPSDSALTDIHVTDLLTGEALGAFSVPDVYLEHYHNVEFHSGHLYVLRRIAYTRGSDDWTHELWRYDASGAGERLYSVQGLDFRVSPDEQWIAGRHGERDLTLLDGQGDVVAELGVLDLAGDRMPESGFRGLEPGVFYRLEGWSADGDALWVVYQTMERLLGLLRLSAGDWQVEGYDVSGLPIYSEWDLQPTTARLAYSDRPVLFDSFARDDFAASGQLVTLSVLDLASGQSDVADISEARQFRPLWLNATTLEYYDPTDTSDDPARITTVVPEPTAEGRSILYIHDDDLWRADLDGAPAERLTTGGALGWQVPSLGWQQLLACCRPQVSPDGRWISYIMRVDGIPQAVLQPVGHEGGPRTIVGVHAVVWSPDSRRVACVREGDTAWTSDVASPLSIYDLAAEETMEPLGGLEGNWRDVGQLAWSPDGTALAFACRGEGISEDGSIREDAYRHVYWVDVSSSDVHAAGTTDEGLASLSPLCWETREGLATELDEARSDPARTCSAELPQCDAGACIHPVSGRLAQMEFASGQPGAIRLRVVRSDGGTIWERDLAVSGLRQVRWSPDGRWLLLDDERPDTPIWRLAADGSGELEPILEDAILVRATARW